jgi:hypothetical protein
MNIHYNNDIQRNATFLFGNERMLAFSSQDQRSSSVKKTRHQMLKLKEALD